jgi:uncharacterized membrane protein YphA (DoxX/SURF4 family)
VKYATIAVRSLLGLMFVLSGVNHFVKFFDVAIPEGKPDAIAYLGLLTSSGLMNVVKGLEISGGALLLVGKFAPLGLTLLMPVIVNILLYELCFLHKPGVAVVLTVMGLFLMVAYRGTFAPFFTKP